MDTDKVDWKELQGEAEGLRSEGASVMYLAADGRLLGLIAVSDPVKSTTAEALQSLREAGMTIVMATGDGVTTAKSVAAKTRHFRSPW